MDLSAASRTAARLAAPLVLCLALAGCDPLAARVADWLNPPSVAEITARVEDLAGRGDLREALRTGEEWLRHHADTDGRLHLALAALYVRSGDPDAAARHLQSLHAADPSAPGAATPEAATPQSATPQQPPEPPEPPTAGPLVGVDGASVVLGPDGTVVRAGDAVARVPR